MDKIYGHRVNSRLGSDSSGGDKSQMLINQQAAFQINSETQKEYESTYNPPNPFVFMNKPP